MDSNRASLELLIKISRELATSLDLRTTLARVLSLSTSAVNAERGSLIVLDKDQKPIDAAIVVDNQLITNTAVQMQPTLQHGLAGWVLKNRQSALVSDTSKDERWLKREDDHKDKTGKKSVICVPLLAADHVSGVLTIVHKQPGFFNEDHLALLQSIADQAGIALNNAWFYDSLQVAHSRYQELFQDSIDTILITDINGLVLEANRQAIRTTGRNREELVNKSIFELHQAIQDSSFEASEYVQNLKKLRQNETLSFEARLINASGEGIPVQVYVRQINVGNETYLQWIARDISERKQLDRLREDMTSMIYHDLRSPLANIISSLDMLKALHLGESNPSITSVVNIASRSTDRMQRLISSLLDINRLEAGQPITNRKNVSVSEIVLDAVQAVQPNLESKEQLLSVNLSPSLPDLFVDPDMIKRVLINLLENSSKFSPNQGKITVSAYSVDGKMKFTVKDTGPGIPAESLQSVFEKFIRLTQEKVARGLGIGLAFCRLAIEAHGGNIWVESTIGEGSTFQFTLPLENNKQVSLKNIR